MPIDVRLLRSAEEASQVVRHQCLRQRSVPQAEKNPSSDKNDTAGDNGDDTVQRVIQIDLDVRTAQRTLNTYKSACRQQRKRPDTQLLQSYQQECDVLEASLKQYLCKISNAIDETVLLELEPQTLLSNDVYLGNGKDGKNSGIFQSPYRRLVELGAVEVIGDLQSKNRNGNLPSSMMCWTGLGLDWAHSISRCLATETAIKATNSQSPPQHDQVLQLPKCMPLEQDTLHEMMGCTKSQSNHCCICSNPHANNNNIRQAPSWLAYLKLQYSDQTVGDKQLPKVLSYSVRGASSGHPLISGDSDAIQTMIDPREQLRENSFPNNSHLPSPAGTDHNVYNLLMLTSSTYYDSRTAQKEWAQRLFCFYQKLLPIDGASSTTQDVLRQRVILPPDLLPAEASRIVIEGYLPRPYKDGKVAATNGNGGSWVILGYISNFSDYPARACRIKNNQQQFCHVLQGLLCSIPETLCWHACYGAVDDDANNGINLPDALAHHFPGHNPNSPLFVPKTRCLEKTKNGRLQVRAIRPPKSDKPAQSTVTCNAPTEPSHWKNAKKNKKESKARMTLVEPHQRLSTEHIRCEALSSPHDFLTFYAI